MSVTISSAWRYAVAVAVVFVIVLLRATLTPFLEDEAPFLFFTLGVMFVSWYGGLFPGLLTTSLSAIFGIFFFVEPYYSLALKSRQDFVQVISFFIVGVTVSWIIDQLHHSRIVAEEKTAEVKAELERRRAAEAGREEILESEKTARLDAERERERVRTVIESISDGFLSFDRNWNFTYANREGAQTLGRAPDDLIGKNLWSEFPELAETSFGKMYLRAMEENVPLSTEDFYPPFNAWYSARAYPSENGLSLFFLDVTERKKAETEREMLLERTEAALGEAEIASRMKDEFLATVSHELRTPLNAILGWTQMLKSGVVGSEKLPKAIETIERNSRSQAQLVEDLLDITRIVSGKIRLVIAPVELKNVVEAAIETVRPAAEAKNIQIEKHFEPVVEQVSGDAERLQQIVWNLLSNAIKFTPKNGKITVSLECADSTAQIVVKDSGVGIETEFLPYVFDRFRQADGSTTRKHGGLGLGLAIVKHLAELHGGQVSADSDGAGLGATFYVRLPLRVVGDAKVKSNGNAVSSNAIAFSPDLSIDLQGLRIMVVDDEPDARELLESLLINYGAQVRIFASAPEALSILPHFRPHLIVSDIGMPEEDGFSFISKVRALSAADGGLTPAIALTAYARIEDRMKALAHGFQMFVPKPVEPAELIAAIRSLAGADDNLEKNVGKKRITYN
jgi:PAS domain S-box-containing protein